MKLWTIGIGLAIGALLPVIGHAQDPWMAPGASGYGYCPPSFGAPGSSLYEELLPQHRVRYDEDSRCDLTIAEAFARTRIRLDYLNWSINGGENTLLGAPNSSGADLSGDDPDNMLLAQDSNGPRAPVPTYAVVPSLTGDRENLNGMRAFIAIPTQIGDFEAEVFFLQQLENGLAFDPTTSTDSFGTTSPVIAATTLLTNGAISPNNMILYSESYSAVMKSSLFGTEANWICRPFVPNQPILVTPILGFHYLYLNDRLGIRGVDQPDSTTTLNHSIYSKAENYVFGPQVGLRLTTHVASRFELSGEIKFVAGINRLKTGVFTQQIYSATEADQADTDQVTKFAPMLDAGASVRYHFSDHFTIFVGYDVLYSGGFSRAYDNIYYNSPVSTSDPPQISLRNQLTTFLVHGISIGGELQFR